jgi:hypothetical protein
MTGYSRSGKVQMAVRSEDELWCPASGCFAVKPRYSRVVLVQPGLPD